MDLSQVGKYIAGIFNKKKSVPMPEKGADPTLYEGYESRPVAPQPQAPGFQARHNPKIDEYTKVWEDAQQKLSQPAPKASEPTLAESVSSLILGGMSKTPSVAGRAFRAPQEMADQRTANAMSGYEAQQKGAQQQMTGAAQMIGHLQDADQAADAVEAKVRIADMQGQIKMVVAGAKNDITLVKSLANLEATGGVTENSAAMILQQLHPDWEWDAAQEAGKQLYQKYISDPSLKMAIQRDKVALQGEQNNNKILTDADNALTDVNSTYHSRLAAMLRAAKVPGSYYAGMTLEQLQKAAADVGEQTKLVGEKVKTEAETRPQKVKNLVSQGNVLEARATVLEADAALKKIQQQYLPEKMASEIHKINAQAAKAEKSANDTLYELGTGKPITATAFFNKRTQVLTNLADMEARAKGVDSQIEVYQKQLDNLGSHPMLDKNGDQIPEAKARQDLTTAINETKAGKVYYEARSKALRGILADIESQGGHKEPSNGAVKNKYEKGSVGPFSKQPIPSGWGQGIKVNIGGRTVTIRKTG